MAKIYDVHSVIVDATTPNLSAHCYTEVYGGQSGCTININGTAISMGASSSLFIGIRSVSGGSGCYLLGSHKNVFDGSEDYL
jgi:hypothetical protein